MQVPDLSTEFTDRVAVITGGGSGIGRAIARRFAAAGGSVYVVGRRAETLKETVRLVTEAGGTADFLPCEVRDADRLAESIDHVASTGGRLDALVNNTAGNFLITGENLSPNGWKAVIDIVLNGSFYATHAAAQHMLSAVSGSIVNVIASYARHGHPGTVHSAAAKGGLVAMTRTLAVEWAARGVRINCIAPGPKETEGAGKALWGTAEARARVRSSVPAKHRMRQGKILANEPSLRVPYRFASTEEIVESAIFLLSCRSSYITGQVHVVDGGRWLGKAGYTDERAVTA